MPNDRLRDALLRNGLTIETTADSLEVSTKTVVRWSERVELPTLSIVFNSRPS